MVKILKRIMDRFEEGSPTPMIMEVFIKDEYDIQNAQWDKFGWKDRIILIIAVPIMMFGSVIISIPLLIWFTCDEIWRAIKKKIQR